MNNAWQELRPKDSYQVTQIRRLSNLDSELITYLYQPIIGVYAHSLYLTLLANVDEYSLTAEARLHADLLNTLDCSLPQLYQARLKLEGIGLVKVYKRTNFTNENEFIYKLMPPVIAEKFFLDQVLSCLLLEKVGERHFKQLRARFTNEHANLPKGFVEMTSKFTKVYEFTPEKLIRSQDILQENQVLVSDIQDQKIDVTANDFSWDLLLEMLNDSYIDKEILKNQAYDIVMLYHQMYGIDEVTMQRLIDNAIDIQTRELDLKLFKNNIYNTYHQGKKVAADDNTQLGVKQEDLKKLGFNQNEIDVIISCETNSPMAVLKSIKEQKGGFVIKEEEWAIESLLKTGKLSNGAINVMIHYALVIQGVPTLKQNYLGTIANDWAQSGVKTAQEAMIKVKGLRKRSNEKQTVSKKSNYNKRTTTRKETLPEWIEQPVVKDNKLSQAEEQAYQARMQQIINRRKEE